MEVSKKQKKIVLTIVFSVLWFAIWFGIEYLFSRSIDVLDAVFFFVILAVIDKHGVAWYVDKQMAASEDKANPSDQDR